MPTASPLRRALAAGLTVFFVLLLCFALGQMTPGDAFSQLELDPSIPAASVAHLRALYLPERSLPEKFGSWLQQAAEGDLGYSVEFHRPVLRLLQERAPASLEILALGLSLAWGVGLALALLPAWLGESARPRLQRGLAVSFHALGSVLTALPLGVLAVAALLWAPPAWLPGLGVPSPWLPAGVLGLAFLPTIYFQAAHALTQVLPRPFLAQARAAGFGPARVLLAHALPNTSDVLVPVASLTISQALVELVILEPLLGWPGLGQLSIHAAQNKDMPVLSALVLMSSLLVIGCNWGSEWLQQRLQPAIAANPAPARGGGGRVRRRWGRAGLIAWLALVLFGPGLMPMSFRAQDRNARLQPPEAAHWLGTDEFGRDEASRLLLASTLTSLLAVAMAVPALAVAVAVGVGSALAPGWAGLGRAGGEVCRSLPWIFVLVAVRAALPLDAGVAAIAATLVVLFAAAAWPVAGWALFGAARQLMQQDFVQAAVGLGATRRQLLFRHLWPNLRNLVATYFALLVAAAIGAEVSLELVGLGLPQPWPTWGNMLDPLRDYTVATGSWWLFAPLAVLVPVLLGLSLWAGEAA